MGSGHGHDHHDHRPPDHGHGHSHALHAVNVGGFGISLAAITLASSGSAAVHRTFGWYRLRVLSALANTVPLFAIAAGLDRGRHRLLERHEVSHATVQVEPSDHVGCHLVQW